MKRWLLRVAEQWITIKEIFLDIVRTDCFLSHTDDTDCTDSHWLKPMRNAALNSHGAEDRRDDCCDEFQHLSDGVPFEFDHKLSPV